MERTYNPRYWHAAQYKARKYHVWYENPQDTDTIHGWYAAGVSIALFETTSKTRARDLIVWIVANTRTMTDINDMLKWLDDNCTE